MAKLFSDQIRDAVRGSKLGHNRMCREASIDKGAMSNFLAGRRGMSLAALDRLAEVLGMQIMVKPKREQKGE
jgi:hypothetical protein